MTDGLVTLEGYSDHMAHKVWTAADLELMTPAEQDAIFEASIVRNLDDVPQEFLTKVRARIEQRISRTESPSEQ